MGGSVTEFEQRLRVEVGDVVAVLVMPHDGRANPLERR